MKRNKLRNEPTMSDNTVLIKVEDLINIALGATEQTLELKCMLTWAETTVSPKIPPSSNIKLCSGWKGSQRNLTSDTPSKKNRVNFKMVQTILHILARQMRLLEQSVEINISEAQDYSPEVTKTKPTEGQSSSDQESPKRSPRSRSGKSKDYTADKNEDLNIPEKTKDGMQIAMERGEKANLVEKSKKDKDKVDSVKEKPKSELSPTRERYKTDGAYIKEPEKPEDSGTDKEKELKSQRASSKERDKEAREKADLEKLGKKAAKEIGESEKTQFQKEKISDKETERAIKEDEEYQRQLLKGILITPRERDNMDKMSPKERVKFIKQKKKDTEEKDKNLKDKNKEPEALVQDKTKKSKSLPDNVQGRKVGSIEVVTLSQFQLLEMAVEQLRAKADPLPPLALPDNKQLMDDLAKGNASLTDAMQAMQLNARVLAAEQVIERMTGLIEQLAAAGALPADTVSRFAVDTEDGIFGTKSQHSAVSRKSVVIDPNAKASELSHMAGRGVSVTGAQQSYIGPRQSVSGRMSLPGLPAVTLPEMDSAIRELREEMLKNMSLMTYKANEASDKATHITKAISDQMDTVLKLNSRISTIHSLVSDYAEKLSGFDAGLTTQMMSFQEQMVQMNADMKAGLLQLEQANNNAETAAVLELSERYGELVEALDQTLHSHQIISNLHNSLSGELRSLVECVEMLREQKADRDEVQDGLRDKADMARLTGLLTEEEFNMARNDLDARLHVCHDKFRRQELVWMGAISELQEVNQTKAELMQLLGIRDDAEDALRGLHSKLLRLAEILGEPKAALLARRLGLNAQCGACGVPAQPTAPRDQVPPRLPALPCPSPLAEEKAEACLTDLLPTRKTDATGAHVCHRWVGGSHTLLTTAITREVAAALPSTETPTKKYTGVGSDGRLYKMEEDLLPCIECNTAVEDVPPEEIEIGAGDQDKKRVSIVEPEKKIDFCICKD